MLQICQKLIPKMRLQSCFSNRFLTSSPPLTPLQLPSPKETHLWYITPNQVKTESLLNQYLEILSPCEQHNILQIHREDLKKSALLARVLVRTTIARYQMNFQPQANPTFLKFIKNIHGKPEVKWEENDVEDLQTLQFNMSHTSSLIACGVTINSPIGIDVEEKERVIKHDVISFAKRYFSKHEVQFLSSIKDSKIQHHEFIKLWTLKEAYVKALGRGFSNAPFKTFTLSNRGTEIIVDFVDDSVKLTKNWGFSVLELIDSHYVAICTQKERGTHGVSKVSVWNTIPFVEDRKDDIVLVHGLI